MSRGFKALKQMTKMNYLFLQRPEDALTTYRELLGYTKVSPSSSARDGADEVESCDEELCR
jgi:COP9 signalosome complex subunit 2